MRPLTQYISCLQLALWALGLYASVFAVEYGLFNWLVTSKQKALEIFAPLLLITVPLVYALQKQWRVTIVDIMVLLLAAYMLFSESVVLNSPYLSFFDSSYPVLLLLAIYCALRSVRSTSILVWGVAISVMIIASAQAFLGLMQLYGYKSSYHGLFAITGTFHNPGPFSGFVVCALPLALSVINYLSSKISQQLSEKKLRVSGFDLWVKRGLGLRHGLGFGLRLGLKYSIQILGWITLVLILLVLPPAQSRAAWIAGLAGCLYVLANHPKVRDFSEKWRTIFFMIRKPIRVIILSVTLTAFLAGAYGLYIMKKGSADGRMLIWQVTSELIKEKPLLGHGAGSFDAKYMDAQAEWFASGKGTSAQGLLAGSPEAPFNELLKLWLERGLIAVLLVAALPHGIFVPKKQSKREEQSELITPGRVIAFKGSLITLLTFGLFSYPFDLSPFVLISITLLAVLAPFSKSLLNISSPHLRWSALPIILILAAFSIQAYPLRKEHYQALSVWQDADRFYSLENYEIAIEAYQEAYPTFEHNGLFLQMYGKVLSMDKQFHKSNKILAEAEQYKSSQIIQNTLGDNHKALGNYAQAEEAYIKSAQMIPSLVFPKYLLAKLYSENGQHKKAKQIAETILNSEVKVESSATREIMNEMKKISEQLSVSSYQ